MIMTFRFNILPVAKGRPKFSSRGKFVQTYTPEKTRVFETSVKVMARAQMKGAPAEGPLLAQVIFRFKKARTSKLAFPGLDIDNLLKSLFDSLNGIAYQDDKQICEIHALKCWDISDSISMEIMPLKEAR